MDSVEFIWELYEEAEKLAVVRHCSNCNGKVPFYDSLKRRHNANGKDIFEYAIYKCDRGHTWNKPLNTYKATAAGEKVPGAAPTAKETVACDIHVSQLRDKGIRSLSIVLQAVEGRWRFDKILANQIKDVSRTQIEKMIRDGTIQIDGAITRPGTILKTNQRITMVIL